MRLVRENLNNGFEVGGYVRFEAPGGTLFSMSGNTFRLHKCMDYLDRRTLTGHWEIQGRRGSLNVSEGCDFWTGEPYRYVMGSNYSWELKWYPMDPMGPEGRALAQTVLDALPTKISWNDYFKNHADTCRNGGWPERPTGIHGYCPRDLEPCYHIEALSFVNPSQDMTDVVGLERVFDNPDPTFWLPVRVKPSARKRSERAKLREYTG